MNRRVRVKGYGGPWYGNDAQRALFERGAKQQFPALQKQTRTNSMKAGRHYRLDVDVPHYEPRQVDIQFSKNIPRKAEISSDGPVESPHRYETGQLCIWFPNDPEENRWVFEDGLLQLIWLIKFHLFREAWWREYGEWLGPEVAHATTSRNEIDVCEVSDDQP